MNAPLDQLQARIGHRFRRRDLLDLAMTHVTCVPDRADTASNQRLEFLGDAVLQLVLTEALYGLFPEEREGRLTPRRALLVNGPLLAALGRELGLEQCLQLGPSERGGDGRGQPAALRDAFEALLGAVYLDSDFATVRAVVHRIYGDLRARLAQAGRDENPKGRLQELVQARHGNDALRYELVAATGEDHARDYEVAVLLHGRRLASGRGSSKKLAEEAAARGALAAGLPDEA